MILYPDTNVLVYSFDRHSFRNPDALHLATAVEAQADIYVTADRRLKSFKGVRVVDVLRDRPGASQRPVS